MSKKWIYNKAGNFKEVSEPLTAPSVYGWCYDKAGNYREVSAPQTAEEITKQYNVNKNK